MAAYDEHLERAVRAEIDHLYRSAGTMRLMATFATGVAAAFVAPALQPPPLAGWDLLAAVLLALAFLATIALVALDRMQEPDTDGVLVLSTHLGWNDTRTAEELKRVLLAARDASRENEGWLRRILYSQLAIAAAAAGVAGTVLAGGG